MQGSYPKTNSRKWGLYKMEFQLITEKHGCPFKVTITDGFQMKSHFHSCLELVFVLNGSIDYMLNGKTYKLSAKDFIFANSYEIHSCSPASAKGRIVLMEIETAPLKKFFVPAKQLWFKWEETYNNQDLDLYQNICAHIRRIIIDATTQKPAFPAKIYSEILGMMAVLYEQCSLLPTDTDSNGNTAQIQKSNEIMDYLNEHYTEQISLNTMAKELHISAPYISKLFKETFGIGVWKYLNQLRIKKSLPALCNTDENILDIAVLAGFNNAKTYRRIFQQEIGSSPTEYRKNNRETTLSGSTEIPDSINSDLLHFLSETEPLMPRPSERQASASITVFRDLIHCTYKKYRKCWNQILSVGAASLLLQQQVQKEILNTVRDLDFKYIRFTGVLSDILQIYQEDASGQPFYFWRLLDEALDFIHEHKLKPFICLGFMPEKLAAGKTPSPFHWNANTSRPKSVHAWTDLLCVFLQHCINRYTYDEVCTWKFEFWNFPEPQGFFWHDTLEKFYDFFLDSYKTFRKILPKGQFGSPGFLKSRNFQDAAKFLQFCQKQKVQFDFICLHMFMLTPPQEPEQCSMSDGRLFPADIYGADDLADSVRQLGAVLSELCIKSPIYITEWNVSPCFHDYSRDTCFMGAYIAHTLSRLPGIIETFSFEMLTDYLDEHIPQQELFAGGAGLKTYNGLPKPSYLALILLNKMGSSLAASGDGYLITASNEGYQILLYNHAFYSSEFRNGTSHKLTMLDRYQIFEDQKDCTFHLHLELPDSNYRIEHHVLSRESGSVYDSWLEMGAPTYTDYTAYFYLHNKAYPEIKIKYQHIKRHLLLSEFVPVHGVLMINITKICNNGQ